MRIVATVAILCVATAVGPRGALAQSKLTFVEPEPAAASQPQPRVYHFHVTAKNTPQASPRAAQAASFEQTETLPCRAGEESLTQGGTPPNLDVDDASALVSPGIIYTGPPVWETVPSWGFHSFAHTSCTCPTYGDDPWQGYCAERQRRYRRSCQHEPCHYAECRRGCEPARCSRAPACVNGSSQESILIRREAPRAPSPAQEGTPAPRPLPKNELPTPADESGRGRD